ncbi:uncharacterized protein TRIVIDRAFT_220706 [Trichoderma virens Gv29-8]|uniref:Uncharacterized protein n=1 Tax=Hypocrea virens (strain Gv29-8 / FGSC 10586) TaxID=413071 RepID=G9MNI4_HYPVG|nr:uncharacterized protein TRIVIDRAFT_220706 [Trichoderma virens Gv29-8]EHK23440.1 hypothetical protein TRIVIDRAFT_220706 [Trichoderma virens Gv29-8]UKZ49741.1 hypothetical protein TrVGV298_003991 [Trichoderma virens]
MMCFFFVLIITIYFFRIFAKALYTLSEGLFGAPNPSLGIRPVVTKEVVTHEGVHIAATNVEAVRRFRTIVAAYDIWRDFGTLPVPIDE